MNKKSFLKLLSAGLIVSPFIKLNELGDNLKLAQSINSTVGVSNNISWKDVTIKNFTTRRNILTTINNIEYGKMESEITFEESNVNPIQFTCFYKSIQNKPTDIDYIICKEQLKNISLEDQLIFNKYV